jgi:hypothetical protein
MKTVSIKEANYSLQNADNFKKELDCDIEDAVEKLSTLLLDYLRFITEHIKLRQTNFARFIIIRGLDTIVNVFNYILLYTKNIDVTYFHCQKAFYFYVEFVSQISEDEKMFLQLSSRDASTYVYKKTMFEINNEFKKNSEHMSDYTKLKVNIINSHIHLYTSLLLHIINTDFRNLQHITELESLYKKINKVHDKTLIHKLNIVIDKLYYDVKDTSVLCNITKLIIKQLIKKPTILDNINNKFLCEDFVDKVKESSDKFVCWFLT